MDKVRPLLAFAFVACLCAGVLAAGMNRAPGHRIVTETRIPATALPRESTLVLGSTLEGRRTTPPKASPTTRMSRLTTPAVSTAPVTTPAVAVSAPRRNAVAQHPSRARHGGRSKPATSKPAKSSPAKPTGPGSAHPTAPTTPTTTQPVTGNPKAPGQVKKEPVRARRTVTPTTAPKHVRKPKKRTVQLTHFTTDLLPGATTTTGHGKGHAHAKSHAQRHAKARHAPKAGKARKS